MSTPVDRAKKVLDIVLDALQHCDNVYFEAYPGFGKTFLGLMVLKNFKNGLYVTRTLTEVSTVLSIAKSLDLRDIAPLYGRQRLCLRDDMHNYDYSLFLRYCEAYRALGMCREEVSPQIISKISHAWTVDEMVNLGKSLGVCLYKAHLVYALSRRYVVTTYEFVYTHKAMENLVRREIAILDECHTLVDYIVRTVSKLDRVSIVNLADMMKSMNPRISYALKSIIRKSSSMIEVLDKIADVYHLDESLFNILHNVVENFKRGRYLYDKDNDTVYVLTTDSDRILTTYSNKRLLMSAYMMPFLLQNLGKVMKIRVDAPKLVKACIDTSITSRYRERGDDFAYRLAEIIINYIPKDCASLVVVPSKDIALRVEEYLLLHGVRIAPPEAIDRVSAGTVIIDVAGGRATEGVTPSKHLKRVIIGGMPYPPPSPELSLLAKIYGFDNVYTYIALLRTIQSIGRLTRWGGDAVLIDKRFKEHIDKFPEWIELHDECGKS